jgi:hypothetical protein
MRRVGRAELKVLIGAILLAWVVLVAVGASRASGDGLPVPEGVDTTHAGALSGDGTQRFLAVPRDGETLLMRLDARNGVMQSTRYVKGDYVVPGVSLDGDTAGLSEDGRTLVLIRPRATFPQNSVSMLVVDPETLQPRRTIELRGDFSFDAISPDGATAFVVEYTDPRDLNEYALRRVDLREGKLLPGSLLPQNDPEEEMRGLPMSRASGPGGRWQYTLYDGGGTFRVGELGETFVHAIDTVEERTLCIDLDWIAPTTAQRMDLRMSADGSEVEVVDPRFGVIGRIDAAGGEAREVSEPFGAPATATADDEGGGVAVPLGLAFLALGGAAVALAFLRRRRRGPAPTTAGEAA